MGAISGGPSPVSNRKAIERANKTPKVLLSYGYKPMSLPAARKWVKLESKYNTYEPDGFVPPENVSKVRPYSYAQAAIDGMKRALRLGKK